MMSNVHIKRYEGIDYLGNIHVNVQIVKAFQTGRCRLPLSFEV